MLFICWRMKKEEIPFLEIGIIVQSDFLQLILVLESGTGKFNLYTCDCGHWDWIILRVFRIFVPFSMPHRLFLSLSVLMIPSADSVSRTFYAILINIISLLSFNKKSRFNKEAHWYEKKQKRRPLFLRDFEINGLISEPRRNKTRR